MDRIKEMRNDERGSLNVESRAVFRFAFRIHHFFLILSILSIPVKFLQR
jgi:hypothetical protein